MHVFTQLIKDDMCISLGVTEPGAIALAVSRARSFVAGSIDTIRIEVNSGIYKNAFTCGIPNTPETGNAFAAALGAVAGQWQKGLSALDGAAQADIKAAQQLIDQGRVSVALHGISSRLHIKATVKGQNDVAEVTIDDTHTNITRIVHNGKTVFESERAMPEDAHAPAVDIGQCTLAELWEYASRVPLSEILFAREVYDVNLKLVQAGLDSPQTDICKQMVLQNGGMVYSEDMLKTAHVLVSAAVEARVRGLNYPAMSIVGSGSHGLIASLPLYACYKTQNTSEEVLLRATVLSHLVTMLIKAYAGKLSAFCGCAIAAGTGAAVGLLYMLAGTLRQADYVINNMASSLTGIVCAGGNTGCVLKSAIAIDIGYKSVCMALNDVCVASKHGINGWTSEQTIRNMGLIATPGMVGTEKTIIDILEAKTSRI